jgi:hypothetical protein
LETTRRELVQKAASLAAVAAVGWRTFGAGMTFEITGPFDAS